MSNLLPFRSLRWKSILCWLLLAACLQAKKEEYPGESDEWHRYESPHFELFSANNDRQSREVLNNLELLRALFFDTFKLKERRPLGLTIFYFGDRRDFINYVDARMRGNDDLAGYHFSNPDRATVALSPAWDEDSARHLVFHEYVHHLVRISGEDPPLWYNEGVAELFSSLVIKSETLEFGSPLPWHVLTLRRERLLPLATIFAVDHSSPIYNTGTHTGQFYAESWALLHYWYYGQSKLSRDNIGQFMKYVRDETNGGDANERRKVFQKLMGMDYPEMEKRLEAYVQNGSYSWAKVRKPVVPPVESYSSRPVGLQEIRERLAELDLRANQSGKAKLALLRVADQTPVKPRILEALGSDAWAQGETDRAYDYWQRSLDAGSENPAIFYELGMHESERWFKNYDYYYQMPDDLAQRLRSLLKRSIALTPDQSEAYEMLAWVEGTVAKPNIANVNLVQRKITTLQHRGPTLTALALVRLHVKDTTTAIEILKEVDATQPGPALTAVVRIIRDHIPAEGAEETFTKPEPATKGTPKLQSAEVIDAR